MHTMIPIIMILIGILVICSYSWRMGYKIGQIDANNGNYKYELIQQNNGEMNWKERSK